MNEAIYALIGAVIGATASVGAMYVQQLFQNHRDRLKMAVDLAIQEYGHDLELAKAKTGSGELVFIQPLATYVIYHSKVLGVLSKNSINKDQLDELTEGREKILGGYSGLSKF